MNKFSSGCDNPSATYRGFRNQALYILHRILTDEEAEHRVYRPEGAEDLAVYDASLSLIEAVQVKDYSSGLAFSHLETFFHRYNQRIDEEPQCNTFLAGFGGLGPELSGAVDGEKIHRDAVVAKLCKKMKEVNKTRAAEMLNRLKGKFIRLSSGSLVTEITEVLSDTVVAADLGLSLELFTYWVYEASENQKDLTREGVLSKIREVADYLAALRDSSSEWGNSVSAVENYTLDDEERLRLVAEYRKGIQASWRHIIAGADCKREEKLQEVHTAFKKKSAVIIRGASGQGKSSLGWRYLHDYAAEGLRFHVKYVEGRKQAEQIANVLTSHVRRLNLSVIVYLDIAPSDTNWGVLVRSLVEGGLKVLIAVREEDFRRSNVSRSNIDYGEVVVDRITQIEARPIYEELQANAEESFLDFEDAWSRFGGEDGGPLLEFTYLVSQGESLKSRISAQINRLRNDAAVNNQGITEKHIRLLSLAALAHETGVRVSLSRLCKIVEIDPLMSPLKLLEDEYLLKAEEIEDGQVVQGLHMLRSKAIVESLIEDQPSLWKDLAPSVIPIVLDDDLEMYLLDVFARDIELVNELMEDLCSTNIYSWAQAGGICRALVWAGASSYEVKNRTAIKEAIAKWGDAWAFVADFNIGMPGEEMASAFESFKDITEKDIEIPSFELTPKHEVFAWLKQWSALTKLPPVPANVQDWKAVGDVAHWLGQCQGEGAIRDELLKILPNSFPEYLSVDQIGDFVSGRACLGDSEFEKWHDRIKDEIRIRFLSETKSIFVEDDGWKVMVFFPLLFSDSESSDIDDYPDLHEQTMLRISLLRKLYPTRRIIASQALGVEVISELMPHDSSTKEIEVKNLPLDRSTALNAIFRSLTNYRQNRPENWKEYAEVIWLFRVAVSMGFRKLYRGWERLLATALPTQTAIKNLPGEELDQVQQLAKDIPMYPKDAVDQWGFVAEDKNKAHQNKQKLEKALQRFNGWKKSFADYEAGTSNFVNKFILVTVSFLAESKGEAMNEDQERDLHLTLYNLTDAWQALETMQFEFEKHFGRLVNKQKMAELSRNERSNFKHLWAVAFALKYLRANKNSNIAHVVESRIKKKAQAFLEALKEEANKVMEGVGYTRILESGLILEGKNHLCLVCDYSSAQQVESVQPEIVLALWRAAHSIEWMELEWAPLQTKWPKIAIVNLVNGKAIMAACSSICTSVIFGTKNDFEVQPHHYFALPVDEMVFQEAGLQTWNSPLLRAVIALQANVMNFTFTCARFYELGKLILDYKEAEAEQDRIFSEFSKELDVLLNMARQSYCHLVDIMKASDFKQKDECLKDLGQSCEGLIFSLDEEANIDLTFEVFVEWMENFELVFPVFQSIMNSLVDVATQRN